MSLEREELVMGVEAGEGISSALNLSAFLYRVMPEWEQNMPFQNMPFGHIDYLELKIIEKKHI